MLRGFEIVQIVAIYVAVLGSICSALLLYLTLDIKKWNSFHRMIFWMSASQLLYDMLEPSFAFPLGEYWFVCLICLVFGVTSFLISTLLGFSVLYVLYFRTIFNFKKWWLPLAIFIAGPNIVMVTTVLVGYYKKDTVLYSGGFDIATYVRLFCLFINLLFFLASKYLVNALTGFSKGNSAALSNSVIAMKVLVDRLKYYALVQAISRVPAAFYEFHYGFNFGYYKTNTLRFALVVLCFNVSLVSPVGFLIIYLRMQPKAMEQLKNRFASISGSSKSENVTNEASQNSTHTDVRNPVINGANANFGYSSYGNSLYNANQPSMTTEILESQYTVNMIDDRTSDSTASENNSIDNRSSRESSSIRKSSTIQKFSINSSVASREKVISNLNDDELIALVGDDSNFDINKASDYNNAW